VIIASLPHSSEAYYSRSKGGEKGTFLGEARLNKKPNCAVWESPSNFGDSLLSARISSLPQIQAIKR